MLNIGESLKYHREKSGLSQRELSKQTGIKHANISRWERDVVIPNVEFCSILADFYGITIDELVGRDTGK